jgi:hypothetical protein
MRFNLFLVFVTCFLVISITPCCAVLIGEGYENSRVSRFDVVQDEVNIFKEDNGLNDIHNAICELQICANT